METLPSRGSYTTGVSAILLASLMWGTTGTAASFIPGIPPATIGAAAMGVGGLVLGLTAVRGIRRVLATPGVLPLLMLGALALATYSLVFYLGMARAGVALGNVLALGSAPLFAGLIEWLVERRRVSGRWILATSVAVIGGFLLVMGREHSADRPLSRPGFAPSSGPTAVYERTSGSESSLLMAGIAIALLAGLSYAVYTFVIARLISGRARLEHRAVISSVQALAALPLLVVVAFTAGPVIAQPLSWGILLYLALVPTAIGHSLLAFSLGRMRASTSTVFSLFEPVVAVVLAATIVGEAITPFGWLGLAVVIGGLALLSAPSRRG